MKEKLMQDLIIKFASEILDEPELTYLRREVVTGNNRLDIVLLDRRGRHVLVEVQSGSLDTKHIDRHIDYSEGYLESHPMADIRILYVANHIDIHRKNFLQRRGHEYKEISEATYMEVALAHGYSLETKLELPEKPLRKIKASNDIPKRIAIETSTQEVAALVKKLKSSERYHRFQTMLPEKIANEAKARMIIQQNVGSFKTDHLKSVFDLVDPLYSQFPGRWFGRLISINQERIFKEGDEKIGRWMAELIRDDIPDEEKIDNLRKGPSHLKNASVGIITMIISGGQSGVTGPNGEFTYEVGNTIKFTVGSIVLGEVPAQAIITPVNLGPANSSASTPKVVAITQFLMTISSTAPSAGIITIPASVVTAAAGKTIDFDSATVGSTLATVLPSLTTNTLVTAANATNHLSSNLNNLFAGTYNGTWNGSKTSTGSLFSGAWTMTIDSNGNVTGSSTINGGGSGPSMSGSMLTQLDSGSKYMFSGTSGNGLWTGTLDVVTKAFSGTWTDSIDGTSGTFKSN